MCSISMTTPCSSRCPNAGESKHVYICRKCRCGIYAGEEYVDVYGGKYHFDCLDNMPIKELADVLDLEVTQVNPGDKIETTDESACAYIDDENYALEEVGIRDVIKILGFDIKDANPDEIWC